MKARTRKILSSDRWFHATTVEGWASICALGVQAQFNKDTSIDLDFGYGFYLSPTQDLAENYIRNLAATGFLCHQEPVIIEFGLAPLNWFDGEYYCAVFEAYDDAFANFVFENRTTNDNGNCQHGYDAIYGVMSDSVPTVLLSQYNLGIISREDAIEGLKKPTSVKQLSLHNQYLCDILIPIRVYSFDIATGCRKELDVDDYGAKRSVSTVC